MELLSHKTHSKQLLKQNFYNDFLINFYFLLKQNALMAPTTAFHKRIELLTLEPKRILLAELLVVQIGLLFFQDLWICDDLKFVFTQIACRFAIRHPDTATTVSVKVDDFRNSRKISKVQRARGRLHRYGVLYFPQHLFK